MAAKYPPSALISIALVLLNLGAFVVLLGGASSLQKDSTLLATALNGYNSGSLPAPGQGQQGLLAHGDLKPVNTPGNFISYEWFKAVFQVLTLLFALGVLAAGQLYRFRIALVGLFAALGVLFAGTSDTFYYLYLQTHNNPGVPSRQQKEVITWFSGAVATATLNFLLVISLGTGAETNRAHNTASGAAHTGGPKDQYNNGAGTV